MAQCVTVVGTVLNTSTTPVGSCTDYVIETSQEYAERKPALTPSDVTEISFAVVAVWAIAWAIKVLRRTL